MLTPPPFTKSVQQKQKQLLEAIPTEGTSGRPIRTRQQSQRRHWLMR
ncbi:hypothetical protein SynPROS71_01906 [Synechococcus sp. PROS-7-1]|nr:hypothetical protein SynPROS71_01906 [Synechococcus sp. PROS-7-1]